MPRKHKNNMKESDLKMKATARSTSCERSDEEALVGGEEKGDGARWGTGEREEREEEKLVVVVELDVEEAAPPPPMTTAELAGGSAEV